MSKSTENSLSQLSDVRLLEQTKKLVGHSNRVLAELLKHLGEVEERGLHLRQGYSSMFSYSTEVLGFSEWAAYHRIRVARLARQFPAVLTLVSAGKLHLSGLVVLAPHLTEENFRELLRAASGKTKRAIEVLVAARHPQPSVPDRVRKLPQIGKQSSSDASGELFQSSNSPARPILKTATQSPAVSSVGSPARRDEESPLSAERFKIQFCASKQLVGKLATVRALLSHQEPNADLATVFELALDLLSKQLMKQRFAQTSKPRKVPSATEPKRDEQRAPNSSTASPRTSSQQGISARKNETLPPASRHIPNAIKRDVLERDGARCTYRSRDGHRCGERRFLEFHHRQPFGQGGGHSLGNITIFCRAHNELLAQDAYGHDYMARARKKSGGSKAPSRHNPNSNSAVRGKAVASPCCA